MAQLASAHDHAFLSQEIEQQKAEQEWFAHTSREAEEEEKQRQQEKDT
ncbi:MAG: hypothetical protein GY700_12475 [Propionibacteriaceae bacterium]|nr:hypothetical protein [Propionibacteriaceae bacterium]